MPNIANISGNLLTDSGVDLSTLPSGSGTTNYLPKWSSSSALGDSLLSDISNTLTYEAVAGNAAFNIKSPSGYYYPSISLYSNNIVAATILGYNGRLYLTAAGNAGIWFGNSTTTQMLLTNSGRLLIGTTVESTYELDVVGDIRSTLDANINGLTVGKGTGQILTNTAVGYEAIFNSTTGAINNIAQGYQALRTNTTGNNNSALGYVALYTNSVGIRNTAVGSFALQGSNSDNNTGVGFQNLLDVTSGQGNTAIGSNTARGITTGSYNTIIGASVTGLSASLSNTIILADGQGNQRLYINSSGNAAIGTTSPITATNYTTFTIGNSGPGTASGSYVSLVRSGVETAQYFANGSVVAIAGLTALPMALSTNGSERMRIFATTGNITMGYGGSPTDGGFKLDISGTFRSTLDANINGLTVGKGGGSQTFSTALGVEVMTSTVTGNYNTKSFPFTRKYKNICISIITC